MDEFIAFLNAIRPISPELEGHIRSVLKAQELRRRNFLVKEGVINDRFFFIVSGLVRCYYMDRGQQISKWFFTKNDVIASSKSFRTQRKGRENMVALSPCVVVYGTFPTLNAMYALYPEFEHHGRLVTQKYSSLWYEILDGIRMKTAKQRVEFLYDEFPDLILNIPLKHLASLLDMNPYTLTKIRSKMKR